MPGVSPAWVHPRGVLQALERDDVKDDLVDQTQCDLVHGLVLIHVFDLKKGKEQRSDLKITRWLLHFVKDYRQAKLTLFLRWYALHI
jgi:hypothetical protein